ncbi:MAG: urease accessory protein [Rhizobiales bacterium 17-65-6]|nr:MAG: urease accessory protein [Rhizobiales bacterium 17-65-6]
MKRSISAGLLAVAAASVPSLAFAHTGAGATHGFEHGFAHPLTGPDHLLAMVAVGLLAAQLGGRALWAVPASFLSLMLVGGAIGMTGLDLPYVEIAIALSVVVLGGAVALGAPLPAAAAMTLAGAFALFHGQAHGAEMPNDVSGMSYAAGFLFATAILHLAGIALGMGIGQLGKARGTLMRGAGAAIALAGAVILVQAVA